MKNKTDVSNLQVPNVIESTHDHFHWHPAVGCWLSCVDLDSSCATRSDVQSIYHITALIESSVRANEYYVVKNCCNPVQNSGGMGQRQQGRPQEQYCHVHSVTVPNLAPIVPALTRMAVWHLLESKLFILPACAL